jgi:hypothetical protein
LLLPILLHCTGGRKSHAGADTARSRRQCVPPKRLSRHTGNGLGTLWYACFTIAPVRNKKVQRTMLWIACHRGCRACGKQPGP